MQVDHDNSARPIRDYALVGDCHGSALIAADGCVDWCCLERFDADPVFFRLLDRERGGYCAIRPAGDFHTARAYLPQTNVLRTSYSTSTGKFSVTDFMPVGRAPEATVHDYSGLRAPKALVRMIEVSEGQVRLSVEYRPKVSFGRRPAKLESSAGAISLPGGPWLYSDLPLAADGDSAQAAVTLAAGDRRCVVIAAHELGQIDVAEQAARWLSVTRAFWEEWSKYCRYDGPYADEVLRSALVLKLLMYAPTGAIAAAPTTSLPEWIGGERNWDYRFCWLRDASFSMYALSMLGYSGEAGRFSDYMHRVCRSSLPRLQIMYGIGEERQLDESSLDHLSGYRDSRPVRVGNGAYQQTQLDVYGEVLDWALLHQAMGGHLGDDQIEFVSELADFVGKHWNDKGQGIWEMRGPSQHHVFGKIMCWAALDRAQRIHGADERLAAIADEIVRSVEQHGIDPRGGYLRQTYASSQTDASLLLVPTLGTPFSREVLAATVAEVRRTLGPGDYLRRYVPRDNSGGENSGGGGSDGTAGDGSPGREGAFLACSFWLVDALLMTGQPQEARNLFERLLRAANDVGLYSEEIDPDTGEFLGNFPQALTHLALIQNAAHLQLFEAQGEEGLAGAHADRLSRSVESLLGVRGWWTSLKHTGLTGRIISSKESILA